MALYFKCWLFAPLLFGIVEIIMAGQFPLLGYAQVALVIGAVPFLVFLICALIWSQKRSSDNYTLAFLISPFVFGLLCAVFFSLFSAYLQFSSEGRVSLDRLFAGVLYFGYSFVVSALYCWPALILWHLARLLRRRKTL